MNLPYNFVIVRKESFIVVITMRHEKLLTEEKCMQSSMDTTISMLSPTNSPQSAFALQKKIGFDAF